MNNLEFDVVIIGGGATGLGVALEASSRGYKTALFEAFDYGSGTSSKSTKLVHGGLRYLANFDFKLVYEGLQERQSFLKNAPHLAQAQEYLIPIYSITDLIKYFIGVKLYDFLSFRKKIKSSFFCSAKKTLKLLPNLKKNGLLGSLVYFDGKFDDTRLLITLVRSAESFGAYVKNYHEVKSFIKDGNGQITSINVYDKISNQSLLVKSKVVINATGTFTDEILKLDNPSITNKIVKSAQGVHLVFDEEVFSTKQAVVIPKTTDNRIMFILPWLGKLVVGTTDVAVDHPTLDPVPTQNEIDFILENMSNFTSKHIDKKDIKSVFAGQRPLVSSQNGNSAKISRKHEILVSNSNLISIVGGKWTIYRLMGQDTIDKAISLNLINYRPSLSSKLKLFGYTKKQLNYPLSVYGSNFNKIIELQEEMNNFDKIHESLPYFQAEVIYAIRYEQAHSLEDVLARRLRAIFLDAKATIDSAKLVASIMAQELNYDETWINEEVIKFKTFASKFI